jgi:hypothetical protein
MAQDNLKEIFKRFYAGMYSRRDEKELLGSQEVNSMMEAQWDRPEEMKGKVKEPDFDAIFKKIENKAYAEKEVKVRKITVYRQHSFTFSRNRRKLNWLNMPPLQARSKHLTCPTGPHYAWAKTAALVSRHNSPKSG